MPTAKISLLERRRIEVQLIQELLLHLVPEVGEERALDIVRATTAAMAQRFGREFAEQVGTPRPGLREFAKVLPLWEQDGALEIEYLEQGTERLSFNVTRCRYAEMYRELGVAHLGEVMSCHRDGQMCCGFNDQIHFERTQTIMQGATHCDFRYSLVEKPVESEQSTPAVSASE